MTGPRPSSIAFALLAVAASGFLLTFADAAFLRGARLPVRAETAGLAARLGLTDIALFTEARYTRHPTQADLHSAFQDHPLAFEHFPTGSLHSPIRHEPLDRKAAQPD
ncbi:MAG: hypothetical protein OHM77_08865 [Candidatus Nitricoxidivorans perseverans]|uniref:Uncharacterized protein n=1 Tax=Candidatus Nitricoxidivorans perseverans TaxID=2975601 RepID=A0AA49FIT6_9PROT|nr:MAG: hypothetical protein OHM77_08865 [Candidatus Nitricoxidivorans perseverans]